MKKWKQNLGRFFAVSLLGIGLTWIFADKTPSLIYFFAGKPTQIQGVLGNRVGVVSGFLPGTFWFGPITVRNVLGQPLFIASNQEYQAFTQVNLKGRLVDFGPSSHFKSIRAYFEKRLGMIIPEHAQLLLVGEEPFQQWRYPMLFGLALLVFLVVLKKNLLKRT
jgi:hypothetical protein